MNGYEITSFPAEFFEGDVNGFLRKGDIMDVYGKVQIYLKTE